jgi:hypothetical protein
MPLATTVLDLATLPVWALWVFALLGVACVFGVALWILPPRLRRRYPAVILLGTALFCARAAVSRDPRAVLWFGGCLASPACRCCQWGSCRRTCRRRGIQRCGSIRCIRRWLAVVASLLSARSPSWRRLSCCRRSSYVACRPTASTMEKARTWSGTPPTGTAAPALGRHPYREGDHTEPLGQRRPAGHHRVSAGIRRLRTLHKRGHRVLLPVIPVASRQEA